VDEEVVVDGQTEWDFLGDLKAKFALSLLNHQLE
jgi:hypothetical protein